jgi:hypothetical protein
VASLIDNYYDHNIFIIQATKYGLGQFNVLVSWRSLFSRDQVPDNNSTSGYGGFLHNFRSLETYSKDDIKTYIEWYMIGQETKPIKLFFASK